MITYFEIFVGVLAWIFALSVVVASFYTGNIYTGILVFLLGLFNVYNSISYMDSSFRFDSMARKRQ